MTTCAITSPIGATTSTGALRKRRSNEFEHFRVELDDVPIHFVHAHGRGPNPIPIVLTHGWPWTFWDWHRVIGPLTDPAAHGLDPAVSFDVVVASLSGFTFSTPLTQTGVTPRVVAGLWDRLMRQVLGHDTYVAAGGDWGAVVSAELGRARYDAVRGVYLSLPPVSQTGGMYARRPEEYAPDEAGWYERCLPKWATATSHVAVHSADPQTLAWALDDSPVGLAAGCSNAGSTGATLKSYQTESPRIIASLPPST